MEVQRFLAAADPPMEDTDLVMRAQAGDRQAFAQLIRNHEGIVRTLLKRMTSGDQALADDLAQDAFVRAYRALGSFRHDAKFSSWLYRIATNVYLSHASLLKNKARERSTSTMESSDTNFAVNPLGMVDQRFRLEAALKKLSAFERAAIVLVHVQEFSYAEAGEILSIPEGTVKTHVHRAKLRLKELLSEEGFEHDYA